MKFKGTAKHVGIGGYYMIDILFLTAAVLISSFNTFENQSYDDIEIYEQRLEKFNDVYGTSLIYVKLNINKLMRSNL